MTSNLHLLTWGWLDFPQTWDQDIDAIDLMRNVMAASVGDPVTSKMLWLFGTSFRLHIDTQRHAFMIWVSFDNPEDDLLYRLTFE